MSHYDHLMRARAEMEDRNRITHGNAVIVYSAEQRAWILPGGMTTTHRPAAERAARLLNRHLGGRA